MEFIGILIDSWGIEVIVKKKNGTVRVESSVTFSFLKFDQDSEMSFQDIAGGRYIANHLGISSVLLGPCWTESYIQ